MADTLVTDGSVILSARSRTVRALCLTVPCDDYLAPRDCKSLTICICPIDVAHIKAVQPFLSLVLTSAPLFSSNLTTSIRNSDEAMIKAVAPYWSLASRSAPLSNNSFTTSRYPRRQARIKGVQL